MHQYYSLAGQRIFKGPFGKWFGPQLGPSPPSTPSTWHLSGSVAGGEPGQIGWEWQRPPSYHAWTSAAVGLARDTTPVPW